MKRKGFTLVELLIVVAVIGILGAMMMVSSTKVVNDASAHSILSNLRSLKVAALTDYVQSPDAYATDKGPNMARVLDALGTASMKDYYISADSTGGLTVWIASYMGGMNAEVKDILFAKAAEVGLKATKNGTDDGAGKAVSSDITAATDITAGVGIRIK